MIELLLCAVLSAQEAPPNTLTEKEKKDGWQLLFDGTTLDGWMSWRTKKPLEEGKWTVQDGTLHFVGKGGGDIYTAESFEHYELSIEWKTRGNSGILFRVDTDYKGKIWHRALEVQVAPDKPTSLGSGSAGGLYALYGMDKEKIIHPKGWNHVRIRIVNGHGVHWMNGQKLYSYVIGSEDWNKRIAKSKFKKTKGFAMKADGSIGLQDHGATVWFRNIKIRRLKKTD